MIVQDVIKRAYAATKLRVKYKLGAGGRDPLADTPADAAGLCDCSGFVMWCLGLDRLTKDPFYIAINGGWANTDAIVADGKDPRGFFDLVIAGQARIGDLMVFGKSPDRSYGHVGVVSRVFRGAPIKVIHCSSANIPTAIQETDPSVFLHNRAVIVRHKDLTDAPDTRPPLTVNLDILTTEFGGGSESGMPSAYGGTIDPDQPQASLPARVSKNRRWLVAEYPPTGNRVRCLINDVGPWNTADAYWEAMARPLAEAQHRDGKRAQNKRVPVNAAGLDLTPAAMDALGVPGKRNTRSARVNWWLE